MNGETCCGRLSAAGKSALAALAIVGPKARAIAELLYHGKAAKPLPVDRPIYGNFGRSVVDDLVLVIHSRQQPEVVEITCHGGTSLVAGLLADIESLGAKCVDWQTLLAQQGEQPIQLEARDALSQASTMRSAGILLDQLAGALDEPVAFPSLLGFRQLAAQIGVALADGGWSSLAADDGKTGTDRLHLFGLTEIGQRHLVEGVGQCCLNHSTAAECRQIVQNFPLFRAKPRRFDRQRWQDLAHLIGYQQVERVPGNRRRDDHQPTRPRLPHMIEDGQQLLGLL